MLASVSTAVSQIVAIVVGTFIISAVTYIASKNRAMYGDVHDIKRVLITPAPTLLDPRPVPGLIDVVSTHGRQLDALLLTGKALIVDKNQTNGVTQQALDRIEAEQSRVAKDQGLAANQVAEAARLAAQKVAQAAEEAAKKVAAAREIVIREAAEAAVVAAHDAAEAVAAAAAAAAEPGPGASAA